MTIIGIRFYCVGFSTHNRFQSVRTITSAYAEFISHRRIHYRQQSNGWRSTGSAAALVIMPGSPSIHINTSISLIQTRSSHLYLKDGAYLNGEGSCNLFSLLFLQNQNWFVRAFTSTSPARVNSINLIKATSKGRGLGANRPHGRIMSAALSKTACLVTDKGEGPE